MNQYPEWKESELKILKENYATMTKKELKIMLLKHSWQGILTKAHRLKLKGRENIRHERGWNAKYTINENFFKEWNENSAYVFGRMITDGHWRLRKSGGDTTIKSIDKENLEKIKFVMKSNHKIKKTKTPNKLYIHVLSIFNNETAKDLNILEENLEDIILNRPYFYHFLRGVFDGDGSINISKNNLKITVYSAQRNFLEMLLKRTVYGKIYGNKENKYWQLYIGNKNAENLCKLMFKPRPFLYLSRKFSRWELWQAMKKSN